MAHPVKWLAMCKLEKRIILNYDVISRPMDHKLNVAFCIKGGPEGVTLKYKAHIVTQGFTWIEGGINELSNALRLCMHACVCVHMLMFLLIS